MAGKDKQDQLVGQLLAEGLAEVSPPGGITHRQGEPFPRQRLVPDDATRMRFLNWVRDRGATDVKLGADGMTVWWMDPAGVQADAGFVPGEMPSGWEPLEAPADAGQRALAQAMADLLEYARASDARAAGAYEPERFAQEIIGLGRTVDAQLGQFRVHKLEPAESLLDARLEMYVAQGIMEDAAGLARDAEALFYDIQAHTDAIEYQAKANLIGSANPLGSGKGDKVAAHSETSAAKVIYVEDETAKRHAVLIRHAGRVKARALDLYAITRRRLRTSQKAVDTFTGKGDE